MYALGLRGYLGHAIVGLVWALWHVPYYLFFLDRSILQNFTTLPLAAFIVQAVIVMIAWAVVYGELWLLTRSIWPAVLMHCVEDAFLNQQFTEKHITITLGSACFARQRADQYCTHHDRRCRAASVSHAKL